MFWYRKMPGVEYYAIIMSHRLSCFLFVKLTVTLDSLHLSTLQKVFTTLCETQAITKLVLLRSQLP